MAGWLKPEAPDRRLSSSSRGGSKQLGSARLGSRKPSKRPSSVASTVPQRPSSTPPSFAPLTQGKTLGSDVLDVMSDGEDDSRVDIPTERAIARMSSVIVGLCEERIAETAVASNNACEDAHRCATVYRNRESGAGWEDAMPFACALWHSEGEAAAMGTWSLLLAARLRRAGAAVPSRERDLGAAALEAAARCDAVEAECRQMRDALSAAQAALQRSVGAVASPDAHQMAQGRQRERELEKQLSEALGRLAAVAAASQCSGTGEESRLPVVPVAALMAELMRWAEGVATAAVRWTMGAVAVSSGTANCVLSQPTATGPQQQELIHLRAALKEAASVAAGTEQRNEAEMKRWAGEERALQAELEVVSRRAAAAEGSLRRMAAREDTLRGESARLRADVARLTDEIAGQQRWRDHATGLLRRASAMLPSVKLREQPEEENGSVEDALRRILEAAAMASAMAPDCVERERALRDELRGSVAEAQRLRRALADAESGEARAREELVEARAKKAKPAGGTSAGAAEGELCELRAKYRVLTEQLGQETAAKERAECELRSQPPTPVYPTPRPPPKTRDDSAALRVRLAEAEEECSMLRRRFEVCKDRTVTLSRFETRAGELERALVVEKEKSATMLAEIAELKVKAQAAAHSRETELAAAEVPGLRAEIAERDARYQEIEAEAVSLRAEVVRLGGVDAGALALRTAAEGYDDLAHLYQEQGKELRESQDMVRELRGATEEAAHQKERCVGLQQRLERLEGERDRRRQAEKAAARVPSLQKKVSSLEFKANKAEWDAKVAAREGEVAREQEAQARVALEGDIKVLHARVAQLEAEKTDEERERRLRAATQRASELSDQLDATREELAARVREVADATASLAEYKQMTLEYERVDIPALKVAAARAETLQTVVDKLREQRVLSFARPLHPDESCIPP